ncbi:hypothetical protein ACF06O_30820 [Streptomyces albidoflavus]
MERKTKRALALGVGTGALAVVALAAVAGPRRDGPAEVPPEAAGWWGAMELYRTLALWAGKRAMSAELNYWKAVN